MADIALLHDIDRLPPTHGAPALAPPAVQAEIRRIFELQRAHAPVVAQTGPAQRRAQLRRLRAAIAGHRQELAAAIREDFGRPHQETEVAEIHPMLAEIDHALRHLAGWMRPEVVPTPLALFGTRSRIRHEPRGVVLIIAPWNYPVSLLVNPLVAALAAGNCAICKPSEKAPQSSAVLARLLREVFPEREVAVLEGGVEVAEALLAQPFDHLFFTGSTQVGRIVMAAAARHLTSVTLELGGKSPAVVDASADIALAARRIVWGKLVNAGQTCLAPDYAIVHESREAEFLKALSAAVSRSYGASDEARAGNSDFARIVDEAHFLRLQNLVEQAVAAGARVALGGRFDASRRYVAPTVLAGVMPDNPVMESEIFGPVLPVLTFRTLDDVVALVRRAGKPLTVYTFSRHERFHTEVLDRMPGGSAVLNHTLLAYGNPHLPFGGVGSSGLGAYHGVHGFRAFSHARAIVRQREPALPDLLRPPYGRWRFRLVARLLRLLEWRWR